MDKYIDYYNDSKKVTYHEQTDILAIIIIINIFIHKNLLKKNYFITSLNVKNIVENI